jgi:tetratricopeptide (TPR) repeat protein
MPELLTTISLGLTSIRVLAGVVGVGYSFLNKDIVGLEAKPLEKLQDSIFGEFVGGLASGWVSDAKNLTVARFYKQIAKIDKDNLNHDLQRAARKAQLIATLFACEAGLQEFSDERQIQGSRSLKLVRNLVWADTDVKWLKAVKAWIKQELKILPKIASQTDINYEEAFRLLDSSLNLSPDEQQKQFIKNTKEAVLAELYRRPYEKFGFTVEYSENGYKLLERKINEGWAEFTPGDDEIIQLKLSERDLPDERKNQDKWFWLLCSFFNEEYKTNERLKAAMLKNLLLEQRKALFGLSLLIRTLDSKLTGIERSQSEILEILKRIELESKRATLYAKHQGIGAKIKVEDLITSKFQETIVGREEEFTKIDNFLRENKSGYFVITGKAGFGKSALLAKWILQRRHQNSIDYGQRIFIAYHFFNRVFSDTKALEAGFTHLLRQICTYRAEDLPVEINRPLDTIIGIIQDIKQAENEPLVIVLDAIDEAEDTIDPFSQQLPEGVYVIISARADKNENPPYLKNWLDLVKTDGSNSLFLEEIDKNSIKKWLSVGRLTKYRLDTEDEIIDLIYQKTVGFPLYLRYLIEEITEALESGETKEAIKTLLKETPKGFENYIEKQFDELCQSLPNDEQEKMESLLSVMSVSLGAFTERDIKKLTALTTVGVHGLPTKTRRWVRITRDEEGNKLFSFDHDLVRKVFATKIFQDEKEEALKRLLAYCAEWQTHKSRYVLRHYPEHLYERQSWQDLYELAENEEFQAAQEEAFPLESDAGLRTLQTALQAAMDTDDAPRMAEFILEHAHKVVDLINDSPLEALRVSVEKAISQAELIYKNDVECGILWFLLLAKRLNRLGRIQETKQILTRLQTFNLPRLLDKEQEQLAVFFLYDLVNDNDEAIFALQSKLLKDNGNTELINKLLSSEGSNLSIRKNIEFAERLITTIQDKNYRATALRLIAQAQIKSGQVTQAIETLAQAKQTAQELANDNHRGDALSRIAQAQAAIGQIEQAEQTIRAITDEFYRAAALGWITQAQIESGQVKQAKQALAQAKKTAHEISRKFYRAAALGWIAVVQTKIGQVEQAGQTFAQAKKTAREIFNEKHRAVALQRIAQAQATAGQVEQAKQTAREINNENYHDGALRLIAQAQIESGQVEQAKQTVRETTNKNHRAAILRLIAVAQATAGQVEQAIQTLAQAKQTAREITNKNHRAAALRLIAQAQAESGQVEQAERTLAQLISSKREITNEDSRAAALKRIAVVQAIAGQIEQAKKTAEEITHENSRAATLNRIAVVQAIAGQVEQAKQTAREINNENSRIGALSRIAVVQAESGQVEQAEQTVREISDENHRADALRQIAIAQADSGQVEQAIQTASEISHKFYRVDVLSRIAVAQTKTGQIEQAKQTFAQAKKTVREIFNENSRDDALRQIAQAQATAGQAEQAKQTAREIKNENSRADALNRVAVAQATSGQVEQAKKTVGEIFNENSRDDALSLIVQAQAAAGQLEQAEQTAREITDEFYRADAYTRIAVAQVQTEYSRAILQTAQLILQNKNTFFLRIASACVSKGNKELFKAFLPLTAYYLDSAYRMVGLMAQLYLEDSVKIAAVLKKY